MNVLDEETIAPQNSLYGCKLEAGKEDPEDDDFEHQLEMNVACVDASTTTERHMVEVEGQDEEDQEVKRVLASLKNEDDEEEEEEEVKTSKKRPAPSPAQKRQKKMKKEDDVEEDDEEEDDEEEEEASPVQAKPVATPKTPVRNGKSSKPNTPSKQAKPVATPKTLGFWVPYSPFWVPYSPFLLRNGKSSKPNTPSKQPKSPLTPKTLKHKLMEAFKASPMASSSRAPEPTSSPDSSSPDEETESDTEPSSSQACVPLPSSDGSDAGDGDDDDGGLEDGFRSKDGKISWSVSADDMRHYVPPVIPRPGPTRFAISRITDIESAWDLLMREKIMQEILKNTNLYMQRKAKPGKAVEMAELRAFLGLLLLAGVSRSRGEAVRSLWHEQTGRPVFRATMSQGRFQQVMRVIRFDDQLTRPKRFKVSRLAAIEPIWGWWENQLQILFNPGVNITVDEQLVSFRGRCQFRQYMPAKPAKYGLKIWAACDAETSYALRMSPYTGKQGSVREVGQGQRVVLQLMEGLQGHTVTCDNFFTSYQLGVDLLKQKNAMLGTIRRNKRELPPELLKLGGREPLSSFFAHTDTHTIVSYVPRKGKNVLLMSTKHREAAVSDEAGRKPIIITDYNKTKGGVDNLDKLVGSYRCGPRTSRWSLCLFFNMLDVSAYNAYVLWTSVDAQWNVGKTWRRRIFLHELGMALVTPWMTQRKCLPRGPTAASLVKEARAGGEVETRVVSSQKSRNANRGFCSICNKRVSICCVTCGQRHVCRKHWSPVCPPCNDKPLFFPPRGVF